jgi:hypothetical protein
MLHLLMLCFFATWAMKQLEPIFCSIVVGVANLWDVLFGPKRFVVPPRGSSGVKFPSYP